MCSVPDSLAWLARRDGSVAIGHGPFEVSDKPPVQGGAFYRQDFAFGSEAPWFVPSHFERVSKEAFVSRYGQTTVPLKCEWRSLEPAPFSEVFQEILGAIHSGVFEKTVPVITETGTADENPAAAFLAACARQSLPLHAYGWIENDSGFAGATPERLFTLDGRHLETMALAGTAKTEDRAVFAVDEKEIREHEYVAQTLVAKLLDLGALERRPREILDLGSIVHFLTWIGVELDEPMSPTALIKRLHPTPALGPLPRTDVTLEMLAGWRARLGCPAGFGAPFGVWENGRFDAVVAIRAIWWQGRELQLPAGCGIIEASRLVNEWRELRLKREAVKRILLGERFTRP